MDALLAAFSSLIACLYSVMFHVCLIMCFILFNFVVNLI